MTSINDLSPSAKQELYEAFGKTILSDTMKNSPSFLDRVMHRIYKEKAISTYDISAEEAGFQAVQDFLKRVQRCVEKDIPPKKLIYQFLPYERKIMLEELEFDKLSSDGRSAYLDVKEALPRRRWLALTSAAAAATILKYATSSHESSERNAWLNAQRTDREKKHALYEKSVEELVSNPDHPNPDTIKKLADTRSELRNIEETINQYHQKQSGDLSALRDFGFSGLSIPVIALVIYSALVVRMKRAALDRYQGNIDFLGLTVPLNEQLIDQGLKNEINKFREKIDEFLMGIAAASKDNDRQQGL
jgi:hypothetical protein